MKIRAAWRRKRDTDRGIPGQCWAISEDGGAPWYLFTLGYRATDAEIRRAVAARYSADPSTVEIESVER